ncbi:MAG TPA: hypothetical protein VHO25_04795 [Polyangiaceae bacterium]|nr:hypothetical protein [Polyangiaceae bacterium]
MKLKDIVAQSTSDDVKAGTRAIKPVKFRLANIAPQPEADPAAPDPSIAIVGLRVLTGAEQARVQQKAQEFATAHGVKEWSDAHPLCCQGLHVHTLALACIDPDSDPKNPDLFFDGGADEILTSTHIGSDNIEFLYDMQRDWQTQCGLQSSEMSIGEVFEIVHQMAAGEADDPLALLRPGTRASFFRTLGSLCVTLLADRSRGGQSSESSTTSGLSQTEASPPASDEDKVVLQ